MQEIGPPKSNGTLDTILVQAQGDTGDHTERSPAMSEALKDSNDVTPPDVNKAAKYDGEGWKNL